MDEDNKLWSPKKNKKKKTKKRPLSHLSQVNPARGITSLTPLTGDWHVQTPAADTSPVPAHSLPLPLPFPVPADVGQVGVMPYAETTAKYPIWEQQAQLSVAERPNEFRKRIGELLKAGPNELPAANAQRISFQLHYRLKDESSFDEAMTALRAP